MEGSATLWWIVPTYDWASFFAPIFAPIFRKLPQVKVTYHFHVRSSKPGVVAAQWLLWWDYILKDGVELVWNWIRTRCLPRSSGSGTYMTRSESSALSLIKTLPAQNHQLHDQTVDIRLQSHQVLHLSAIHPLSRGCGQCGQLGHNKRSCTANHPNKTVLLRATLKRIAGLK